MQLVNYANVTPISCNVAELLPFYGLIKQLVKQKIYNLGRRNARPTQVSAVKDLYTTCYLLMESPLLTMNHGHNDRLSYHPRANKRLAYVILSIYPLLYVCMLFL